MYGGSVCVSVDECAPIVDGGAHTGVDNAYAVVGLGVALGCKMGIMVRYLVTVFVQHLVPRAEAAISKARAFQNGPEVIGTVTALLICVVCNFCDRFQVWLPSRVVVCTVPHNVVRVSPLAFAVWVGTNIRIVNAGSFEAVRGTDAPCQNGGKEPPVLLVGAVMVTGPLGCKVGHGSIVIKMGTNANHVLAIARGFVSMLGFTRLVNPQLQVVEYGVPGGLAYGGVIECGVGSVQRQFCPIGESKGNDASICFEVDVEPSGSSVKAEGRTLWEPWEVGGWCGVMSTQYFFQVVCNLLVPVR